MISTESADKIPYISGVFDTIGCIKIEPSTKGKAHLNAWITSKNFRLMELLQKMDGYVTKRPDGQFRIKWNGKRAYVLLKSMTPHLIIMRDQALVGLEFWEERTNNPQEDTDATHILRLKLLKKDKEEGG